MVFNLDLNRESGVWEPNMKKALPPLVDFAILGTTKGPEFCDLRERVGL